MELKQHSVVYNQNWNIKYDAMFEEYIIIRYIPATLTAKDSFEIFGHYPTETKAKESLTTLTTTFWVNPRRRQ